MQSRVKKAELKNPSEVPAANQEKNPSKYLPKNAFEYQFESNHPSNNAEKNPSNNSSEVSAANQEKNSSNNASELPAINQTVVEVCEFGSNK